MDFDRAARVGHEGEQKVSAALRALQQEYGFQLLDDVFLTAGPMTAQLDHILIDRYGILIVETKTRNRALIVGSDAGRKWTACYPGKKKTKASFQNPLDQARTQENTLRQALEQAGERIDPDYVRTAVVFVGANLDGLDLGTAAWERVTTLQGVPELVRGRYLFSPNLGGIDQARVGQLQSLLRQLDMSGSEEVLERHSQYRRGSGSPATRSQIPPDRTALELNPQRADGADSAPSGVRAERQRRGGSAGPPRTSPMYPATPDRIPNTVRYPHSRPAVPASHHPAPVAGHSYRPPASRRSGGVLRHVFSVLVASAIAISGLGWLVFGGGLGWLTDALGFSVRDEPTAITSPESGPAPAADVDAAQLVIATQALLDAAPHYYQWVADPDHPEVSSAGNHTTYRWALLEQALSPDGRPVSSVSLTLDVEGHAVNFTVE